MILHVILISALSAPASVPSDSVRPAPKSGVVLSDSALLSLPTPTIKAPKQPEQRIAAPVTLAWPASWRDSQATEPLKEIAQVASTAGSATTVSAPKAAEPAKPPVQLVAGTTNQVVLGTTSHVAIESNRKPAPEVTRPVEVVQQAAALAPADASAVALPLGASATSTTGAATAPSAVAVASLASAAVTAAPPASSTPAPSTPAPSIRTADGRVVLGTRSTVVVEPLHAVPLPVLGVRLAPPTLADSIVVYKREHTLTLFLRGVPVRSYFVALGSRPVGDKVSAGDDRTPEGLFTINAHNPASKYHLALRISYPDDAHRARAAKLGVDPGGDIMIHGLPLKYSNAGKDHRLDDWTNGCVALTNEEIEEIWHAVPDGTPIQIKP